MTILLMALLTVPATLSIVLAVLQLGSGAAWQTWLGSLLVSSVALAFTWPMFSGLHQDNRGQWLSWPALLAIPGSILFALFQIVGYGAAGGPMLNAFGALLAWIVLGILSCFVLGRIVVYLHGFPVEQISAQVVGHGSHSMPFLDRLPTGQPQSVVRPTSSYASSGASDDIDRKQRYDNALAHRESLDQATVAFEDGDYNRALSLACAALESVPDDHTLVAEEVRARAREIIIRIPNIQAQGEQWWREATEALSNMYAGLEQMANMDVPLPSDSRAWEKCQQYAEHQMQLAEGIMDSSGCAFNRFEYLQAVFPQQRQALVELREGVLEYGKGAGALVVLDHLKMSKSGKPLDETTADRFLGIFTSCCESGRQHIRNGLSLAGAL